jgi:hypothetical protein
MADFYIVPPRLIVGSFDRTNVVTSFNSLRGDITLTSDTTTGIKITASGGNFKVSIISDFYIKKAGDTVNKNIVFAPDSSSYGLAVGSGASDPSTGVAGGLFYNTNLGSLRVYDGIGWGDIVSTGGIAQSTADVRYLKLDGTNTPTGNLSLGSTFLRFANLTTQSLAGLAGQVYYNTTTNQLNVYNGSGWASVGNGITAIFAGVGMSTTSSPITSQGTLSVNQSFNFNFTGTHTHTSAINFAAAQTFNINKLTVGSQTAGDIITYNGANWVRFGIGSTGQVLAVNAQGTGVTWSASAGGFGGTNSIGVPDDGTYVDGYFTNWTSSTLISNAFDEVNEFLKLLAPSKPGYLSGTTLTATSVPTYYSVKLSAGLTGVSNNWYQAGIGTGDTITRYYLSGAHTLNTASTSTSFSAGNYNQPSTYGTMIFRNYNSTYPSGNNYGTIDLTVNSAIGYSSDNLRITALGVYNSLWNKVNAQIASYTQSGDGYEGFTIYHSENTQETNKYEVWRDTYSNSTSSPTFAVTPTATATAPSLKYLSGIAYYGAGSGFSLSFASNAGIYNRCYNPNQVFRVTATGLVTRNVSLASAPLYSEALDRTGANQYSVTLDASNQSSFQKYFTVTLFKAHGSSVTSTSGTISKAVNTYGNVATDTYEAFQDEAYRVIIDSATAWTSTITITNGNLQVRSGTLIYPVVADYDTEYPGAAPHSFTGSQEYQRFFFKTSASTGSLSFGGISYSQISPYGTGDINVLIFLDNDAKWFDLGVPQGSNSNDGSARASAFSSQVYGSSGSTLNWSLGTYTTGPTASGNQGKYRLVVIYRTNNLSITSITSS